MHPALAFRAATSMTMLAIAALLAGCGQAGPLYHPQQEQPAVASDAELEATESTQVQVR